MKYSVLGMRRMWRISYEMYVPVCTAICEADCPEYAVEVLQELLAKLKGKYHEAQSRQFNGDRPFPMRKCAKRLEGSYVKKRSKHCPLN